MVRQAGLFSAVATAFIIESYKTLSPDSGDQTVALLSQLLSATATLLHYSGHNPTQTNPTNLDQIWTN